MDAADSDIIDTLDMGTEIFCRLRRFLRYRDICRPRCAYRYAANVRYVLFFKLYAGRLDIIGNLRKLYPDQGLLVLICPRTKDFAICFIQV